MNQLTLLLIHSELVIVEERSGVSDVLPINDSFVRFRLDLYDEQLFVANTLFVHLTGMLFQHIIEISSMEASVEVIFLLLLFVFY